MAVSLNSQSKQSKTNDFRFGLANVKSSEDENGVFWVLPGQQEKIRCKEEVSKHAEQLNKLISANLERGKHRKTLI